jgi:hypothetical protein
VRRPWRPRGGATCGRGGGGRAGDVAALGGAGAGGAVSAMPSGGGCGDSARRRRRPARCCAGRALDDVGDDDGDVVGPAAAQGQLDQPVAGLLRIGDLQRLLQRLQPADRTGQAVGAQQVAVPGPDLAHGQVGLDAVPGRRGRA